MVDCVAVLQSDLDVAEPQLRALGEAEVAAPWQPGKWSRREVLGVRDHAFGRRGLERVISLIRPINEPSQGVARKLGMRPEREVDFHGYRHIQFAVRHGA